MPKISGEIRRFLRDDGTVKVSRGIKEQSSRIRAARNTLEQRIGREPTISELSRELGISPEDIAFAETATGPAESLQRESGEDGFTLELVLGDYAAEEKLVEHVALRAAIEKLPERERQVVALRYYHGMTQQSCARVMPGVPGADIPPRAAGSGAAAGVSEGILMRIYRGKEKCLVKFKLDRESRRVYIIPIEMRRAQAAGFCGDLI